MKKLFYVCEADSGGIMEYAIRQSAALARAGVEVVFLCKPSFPRERLGEGVKVEKLKLGPRWNMLRIPWGKKAEHPRDSAEPKGKINVWPREGNRSIAKRTLKNVRGPVGKIFRVWRMIADFRAHARQVAELAEKLASTPKSELTTEDTIEHRGRCEKEQPKVGPKGEGVGLSESKSTEEDTNGLSHGGTANTGQGGAKARLGPSSRTGAAFSNPFTSELARDSENTSLNRSAIASASETNTRDPLPVTRHNLGEAEVAVLFACYKEYFAPFWVGPLRRLAKKGIVIRTIAHDPVRDFVVGPIWWHRWSVRLGYSFVRDVFVHDETPVDFGGKKPAGIRIHQIPHGPYEVAEPKIGREAMRRRLGFSLDLTTEDTEGTEEGKAETLKSEKLKQNFEPLITQINTDKSREAGQSLASQAGASESDSLTSKLADSPVSESPICSADGPASIPATSHPLPATPAAPDVVFLAFGQIRDGKNLDLFLRAMTRLPESVKLLVAGKGDSGSSRPPEFYQKLAKELGVGGRCRWDIRRIPDEEVGDIFAACDVVLVTYSAKFRSASGVLNAAVSARKPVLASCGGGPLKSVVEKYDLGVFADPDDVEEIVKGASKLATRDQLHATRDQLHATPAPAWDRYERENSWEQNARKILLEE
jgi:glycosyltransferase involved in cell wall biosynthesis